MAVKHLAGNCKHVESELKVMRHIAAQAIPRAVASIAEERDGPDNVYVVLEGVFPHSLWRLCSPHLITNYCDTCRLVQGMSLAEYCFEFIKQGQLPASEDRMLPVAAQLLDVSVVTIASSPLHCNMHVCSHMNLKHVCL